MPKEAGVEGTPWAILLLAYLGFGKLETQAGNQRAERMERGERSGPSHLFLSFHCMPVTLLCSAACSQSSGLFVPVPLYVVPSTSSRP